MEIIGRSLLPFDMQYPVYNFFFPGSGVSIDGKSLRGLIEVANAKSSKRAIYVHIPFCDTLCSFCPFTRGRVKDENIIELYVQAVINETAWKNEELELNRSPINAIFFGGGTPSMMTAEQIERIGFALHQHFDLSKVKEFSFEIEVKSLTLEKAQAMKRIGVTHPRFGLQSFSKKWRDIFTLTATMEQIYSSLNILTMLFNNVSFDILYGMSGHTEEELVSDLQMACDTGISNIDIYPIDNIMTQPVLHRALNKLGYTPTSATRKFSMNVLVDSYMRTRGYMPHNGHGYRKVEMEKITQDVIYKNYRFEYHEHVYGYQDHDLVGFGASAISSLHGVKIINTNQRSKYISELLQGDNKEKTFYATQHNTELDTVRPLALRLPYFGSIEKSKTDYHALDSDTKQKLENLVVAHLITESDSTIELTKVGWYNYVNIMYYLMPSVEQQAMDSFIADQLCNSQRDITENEVLFKTAN